MWLVSAVVVVDEVLRLSGLQVAKYLVCVDTGLEVLVKLLAFLVFQGSHDSVIVCTLHQHSFVWNACQLVVDLQLR